MGNFIHKITDTVRAICGFKDRIQPPSAIIVASGNSTRMGEGISKQMILLDGIPVVARTIMAFDACECISEIVVVAKQEEFYLYKEFQKLYGFKKLCIVHFSDQTFLYIEYNYKPKFSSMGVPFL